MENLQEHLAMTAKDQKVKTKVPKMNLKLNPLFFRVARIQQTFKAALTNWRRPLDSYEGKSTKWTLGLTA